MGTNQDHKSGCLFPFGDDFLPILVFFFNINDPRNNAYTIEKDEDLEDEDPEDEDLEYEDQDECADSDDE